MLQSANYQPHIFCFVFLYFLVTGCEVTGRCKLQAKGHTLPAAGYKLSTTSSMRLTNSICRQAIILKHSPWIMFCILHGRNGSSHLMWWQVFRISTPSHLWQLCQSTLCLRCHFRRIRFRLSQENDWRCFSSPGELEVTLSNHKDVYAHFSELRMVSNGVQTRCRHRGGGTL